MVCKKHPKVKIVTSEIDLGLNPEFRVVPGMGEFGDRYFGTIDEDDSDSPHVEEVLGSTLPRAESVIR